MTEPTTFASRALAAFVLLGALGFAAQAQEKPTAHAGPGQIHVLPVQGNVYLLSGDGGNITAQVGEDGVLLVNAGRGEMTGKLMEAIRTISDKPIHYLINTDDDPENI